MRANSLVGASPAKSRQLLPQLSVPRVARLSLSPVLDVGCQESTRTRWGGRPVQLAGGTRSGGIHSFPSVGRLRSSRIPWRSSAQPAHTRWRGIGDSAQAAPVRCDAEQRRAESVRGATAELAEAPLAAPASSVRRQPSDGTGRRRPHGGASHHSLLAWPRPTLLARGGAASWRGPPPREATAATGGSLPLAAFPLDS